MPKGIYDRSQRARAHAPAKHRPAKCAYANCIHNRQQHSRFCAAHAYAAVWDSIEAAARRRKALAPESDLEPERS